jgi:hypothetical protein
MRTGTDFITFPRILSSGIKVEDITAGQTKLRIVFYELMTSSKGMINDDKNSLDLGCWTKVEVIKPHSVPFLCRSI